MRRSLLFLLLASAALAAPAQATSWTAPSTLSSGDGTLPAVEVASTGDALVAWSQAGGAWVAQRPAGDVFQAPERIGDGGWPSIALNAAGDAIVAWTGANRGVYTALRARQRPFGAPQLLLGGQASSYGGDLRLDTAMNARGDVAVAWLAPPDSPGTGTTSVIAATRPADGGFGPPQKLGAYDATAGSPAVALDDAGRVTVAWQADKRTWTASGAVGGAIGAAEAAGGSPAPATDSFALATTPAGEVTLIAAVGPFPHPDSPLPNGVYVATKPPGGQFGGFRSVAQANGAPFYGAMDPRLALTADGPAAVSWWGGAGAAFDYRAPGAADWQPPQHILSTNNWDDPRDAAVGIDSHGQVVFALGMERGMRNRAPITVVRRATDGTLDPPVSLGDARTRNVGPAIAFDGIGNGVLVWEGGTSDPGDSSGYDTAQPIRLALYDGSRPRLAGFALADERRRFKVKLTEPARVAIRIKRGRTGVATIRARLHRGTSFVRIGRRVRARLRKHGRYVATATARDGANKRARARRLRFAR